MPSAKAIGQTIGVAVLLTAWLTASPARAHGDLNMEFDTCVLQVGPNRVHFTGYQPNSTQQEFCEDIPQTGRTIIVLDFFDPALRKMQTEFRVIRDVGLDEAGDLDPVTIVHLPPAVHPTGTFNFEYDFPQAGKFIGLISVRDENVEYTARFPFAVGLPPSSGSLVRYLFIALALLAASAVYWFSRGRVRAAPAVAARIEDQGWADQAPAAEKATPSEPAARP